MPKKLKNSNDNARLTALEVDVTVLKTKAERFTKIVDSDTNADSVIERKIIKLETSMNIFKTALYVIFGAIITAAFTLLFKIY